MRSRSPPRRPSVVPGRRSQRPPRCRRGLAPATSGSWPEKRLNAVSWVSEAIKRAQKLLDQGEESEAVRVLAEAERGAVARDYPELLPKIAALAADASSRSEGETQRKAQELVARIERRAAQPAQPARSEEPKRAAQPAERASPERTEETKRAPQPALPAIPRPLRVLFGVVLIVFGVLLALGGTFAAIIAYAWGAHGWALEMLVIYGGFAGLALWGGVRLVRRKRDDRPVERPGGRAAT